MERHEALMMMMIFDKRLLAEAISFLERLKLLLVTIIGRRGYSFFCVGIDVDETCVRGSVAYKVMIFDNHKRKQSVEERTKDILEDIKAIKPEYQGNVEITSHAFPYADAFLRLGFLKDMQKALGFNETASYMQTGG